MLTKLRDDYTADVKLLAEAARKANGGLIYLCNPNNPTSAAVKSSDVDWLVANLPANTMLLVDEAYIHFVESPDVKSAMPYVRQGKDVIVARTFSKIYGMAGLRVGFAAAKPAIIAKARAASDERSLDRQRPRRCGRAERSREHRARAQGRSRQDAPRTLHLAARAQVKYIEPNANFLMIDTGRNAREFISAMPKLGVAPGRPFPPLDNMLRVTIGTDAEMAKFRDVFWKVYKG